jgi:hypothetical protein
VTPHHAYVYCPTCKNYRAKHQTYVLMFGEVMCIICQEWTGDFEHEL